MRIRKVLHICLGELRGKKSFLTSRFAPPLLRSFAFSTEKMWIIVKQGKERKKGFLLRCFLFVPMVPVKRSPPLYQRHAVTEGP